MSLILTLTFIAAVESPPDMPLDMLEADTAASQRRATERSNQVELYRVIYSFVRDPVGLRTPDQVQRDASINVLELVDQLVSKDSWLPFESVPARKPACTEEEGHRDETGALPKFPAPTCDAINPNSLLGMDWPLKPYTTCVRSQGVRGTCVAHAMIAALESMVAVRYGRWLDLSEQSLYARAKLEWQPDDFNDNLTTSDALHSWTSKPWFPMWEYQWRYNRSIKRENFLFFYKRSCDDYFGLCTDTSHQAPLQCNGNNCFHVEPHATPSPGFRLTQALDLPMYPDKDATLRSVRALLSNRVPVIMSFENTAAFRNDAAGFVKPQAWDTSTGGHAVLVVGYVSNAEVARDVPSAPRADGGGYYIIKNSWGSCAGDNGFYYLPAAYVKRQARFFVAATQMN